MSPWLGERLVDPDVDDPADDPAAGGTVHQGQHVAPVAVGAEQLGIDVDDGRAPQPRRSSRTARRNAV